MAKAVDMELKMAFAELQKKMINTSQKLRLADVQIDGLRRRKQHAEITEREISSLDSSTKLYESVGRMFLLSDINDIKTSLKEKQKEADEKIKQLENSKTYLEKNLVDAENNLREMVQAKQGSSDH